MTQVESKGELVEGFRVQTILKAAVRVISRKGPTGTTMQEIADEAGIAKGTIYLYFRNRNELLERVADAAFSALLERLEAVLTEPGALRERLRALILAKLEFFDAHQEFLRVYMLMRAPEGPPFHEARRRRSQRPQYARYLGRLQDFLAAAMARGEAKAMDPGRVALLVAEGVNAILLRRLSEAAPPPRESDVAWVEALLLDGLAVDGVGR